MTNASLTVVALRGKEIDAFLARPDPGRPIILLYGPDAGLVRERADALLASAVDDPNDPFSLVRLDGDELSAEPSRLVDEAMTVPLFGGRRAIRVRAGSRRFASAIDTPAEKGGRGWLRGDGRQGLPHRDRGRRAASGIATAQGLRTRQDGRRDRLLSRYRARSRQADGRRAPHRQFAHRAGRPRGADVVPRRRPAGLAQRAAQAHALCPRQGRDHAG